MKNVALTECPGLSGMELRHQRDVAGKVEPSRATNKGALPGQGAGDNRNGMANLPTVIDQIDRLFDELVHRRWGAASARIQPAQVRIVEDGWEIEVPVPELGAKDLEVQVSGRELRVQGTGRKDTEHRWAGASARSWSWSSRSVSFSRSFLLPEAVDPNDVDARYENGVLHIHVRRRATR